MSKLGVSVLDTDFIIKSAVSPSPEQPTLFERILTLGQKFYIHHQVHEEVEWPKETADLLDRLIKKHQIKMVYDRDLVELLDKHYRIQSVRTFLGNLKECCDMFGTSHYEHYYKHLEALLFDGTNIQQFCEEFSAGKNKAKPEE